MFDFNQPAYQHLRKIYAEQTKQLVAWTGAGLSAPANMPSWVGLRTRLCEVANRISVNQDETVKKKTRSYAELANSETDLWLAFDHLKHALGNTTFGSEIKLSLTPNEGVRVLNSYCLLWELGFRGVINLNIDGLATRATGEVFGGRKRVIEFSGQHAPRYSEAVFGGANPFILNLHGVVEDEESWVFTKEQFNNLFRTSGLTDFISAIAQSRALVFV